MMEITEKVRQHYRLTRLKQETAELLPGLDSGTKANLEIAIAARQKEVKDALPKGK
jgi:hypothetical protein